MMQITFPHILKTAAASRMQSLLLISDNTTWLRELKKNLPNLKIQHFPDISNPENIEFALVWNPKPGILSRLPSLKVIFSIGAGVDHILKDKTIPQNIPIIRMSDQFQHKMIVEYTLMTVLNVHRDMDIIVNNSKEKVWIEQTAKYTPNYKVGVLGLGNIGSSIAKNFSSIGFSVLGWSRSQKKIDEVETFAGFEALETIVPQCDYLICALPLTSETYEIINADFLSLMKKNSTLINIGRGEHINEKDLLEAIDNIPLKKVFLDVFRKEPLDRTDPLWSHPKILVTPHMAGEILPESAVFAVKKGILDFQNGITLQNVFDRKRGY